MFGMETSITVLALFLALCGLVPAAAALVAERRQRGRAPQGGAAAAGVWAPGSRIHVRLERVPGLDAAELWLRQQADALGGPPPVRPRHGSGQCPA